MKYKLYAMQDFVDMKTGDVHPEGQSFVVDSYATAYRFVSKGVANIDACPVDKPPRVVFFAYTLARIGGIETFCQNMARRFGAQVGFVFAHADPMQLLMLAKHSPVTMDESSNFYAVPIAVYNSVEAWGHYHDCVTADEEYQVCHADYDALRKINDAWRWKLAPVPDDHVIAVSEVVQKSIKSVYGRASQVHPPVMAPPAKRLVLGAFTRATAEKGIDRLLNFCDQLTNAGVEHCLFMCADLTHHPDYVDEIERRKQIVVVPPTLYSAEIMKVCDYVCQFSLTESYCFTVHEALAMGKPVLVSDIPAFRGLVKDGQNGYVIKDWENIDLAKITGKIPRIKPQLEPDDGFWAELIIGEPKC